MSKYYEEVIRHLDSNSSKQSTTLKNTYLMRNHFTQRSLSLSLSLFPICFTNPCLSVKYKVEQVIIIFFHLTSKAYKHEPMTSLSYHFCYLE